MENIKKYFTLTDEQERQFSMLGALYADWNSKINVISRKDIDNVYVHHVLHSLAIAKVIHFTPGTNIIDIGTGGGFPGIPLAILFPECQFTLLDSVGKKIKVASEIASAIGLKNVRFVNDRMENEKGLYDFAVSRAAMSLSDLVKVCKKNIAKTDKNALPNGLICLKGGDMQAEIQPYKKLLTLYHLSQFFSEEYFKTKNAVYLPIRN
ncbi:MAG: 16S rRNA (guanine(527)-N(7))-methyltransferase RsmG, partial [Paludibacteraceae bacterium]|nr:16S rRNA (guanine(527)-N(7))-methyltransferase RsmG [Paludibacteraceae bacterium]